MQASAMTAQNTTRAARPTGDIDVDIQSEQIRTLYSHSPPAFAGNLVVAVISAVVMWNYLPHDMLVTWASIIIVVTLVRIGLVWRFRRVAAKQDVVSLNWAQWFQIGTIISGCLWGSMGILFYETAEPITVVYTAFMLGGMSSAAVVALSPMRHMFMSFAAPTMLPFVVKSFIVGGFYTAFGLLGLFLFVVVCYYSMLVRRAFNESIRLRFENLALVKQLSREKERAESANNAKTKFLAAASHDLRQPTHAMALFLGAFERILRRRDGIQITSTTLLPIVDRMKATMKGMGSLLNSLLDTSRLEAGAVPVERAAVRLQDLFDALQSEFGEAVRSKGLRMRFQPTALAIESDPVLLRRILSNLITNAVKYTARGRVTVGCRRQGDDVEIQVHDTGIGIAAEHHESIFEEFIQLDNTARNREQGLGLGLSIVRRGANLLGHRVGIRSALGRGSMFSISVPRVTGVVAREAIAVVVDAERQHTGTIIVIDDDTSAREAVEDLLRAHGYDIIAAASIPLMRTHLEGRRIGARMIVADYRLGDGVTGVEAIRAIQPMLAAPAPAIIVTGDTSPDRIREAQASGYPLLHKPLDADQLLAAIQTTIAHPN
jgi:signal transduction histidine kinase/CheY-like chemotaxis protein